jgi:hypothetical protein
MTHQLAEGQRDHASPPKPGGPRRRFCRGSGAPSVSRPKSIAIMLSAAKQVITAVTLLKLPPKAPTKRPTTSGPKLVMTRAVPVQNPMAVERI